MKLIKLLPIVIGIGAVSSGAVGGVVNNTHHPSTLQTSDPFVTWAIAAQKDAQTNFAAILKVAPVADWKMNDHIKITNIDIDIWNSDINIELQDGSWGMRATIIDIWIGQDYNINQWWCSIEPRDTNAHLRFENWYTGWNNFSKLDVKLQLKTLIKYWNKNQLKAKLNNNTKILKKYIEEGIPGGNFGWDWDANILNIGIKGQTVTANYRFYPHFTNYYYSINVTLAYNGELSFNSDTIQPNSDWTLLFFS